MALTEFKFDAKYNDRHSLDELERLIKLRAQKMRETSKDAVIATTINVVGSIRSDAVTAPAKANDKMVTIRRTHCKAALRGHPARWRVISNGHELKGVYPVNNMYGLKGEGNVYEIFYTDKTVPFTRTKNRRRYILMAPDDETARAFALKHAQMRLDKSRGMNNYALGVAQARLSSRSEPKPASGSTFFRRAHASANVITRDATDSFAIHLADNLNYASLALKHGASSVSLALQKAANRTAGMLRHKFVEPFDGAFKTPFPDIVRRK